MLKLKDYQEWALDALREYFQECSRTENADTSFYTVTHNTFGHGIPYNPVEEIPGLPYVCLRIPTGGGNIIHSLANVLKLRRPIVIVDEAHNARTSLSFATLSRFSPSCIIEFTATPDRKEHASNVLYSASAADLKSARMIKMPIHLTTRPDWKELLGDAVHCRNGLEQKANLERQQTREYIRPVMLIQAQPKRKGQETLSVDVVKNCLLIDHKIPEEQIALATGAAKELEGIDMAAPDVPTINDHSHNSDRLFTLWEQARGDGLEVAFDFTYCRFLRHNAVAFIGGLARLIQSRDGQVTFRWNTLQPNIFTNLAQNGFLAAFGHHSNAWLGNSIPFRVDLIQDKNAVVDYLKMQWLGRGWVQISDRLRDSVVGNVLEIYANAFEHSHSEIGVFSAASITHNSMS